MPRLDPDIDLVRPKALAPGADRIGRWLLTRDIDIRIAGYARGGEDPVVVEAAAASL